jgi:hypothetical protein
MVGTIGAPTGVSVDRGRDTGQSLRRRSRDESGSILVLFSIFLTLFLLLCAIVIDVGYWWANAKKAQIAADACALAAAQSIPTIDPTSGIPNPQTGECVIESPGPDYVFANIPTQGDGSSEPLWTGTRVEWPYVNGAAPPDPTKVEATVYMKVGSFFGRIVGHGGIKIERRAVAERSLGHSEVTIHAHDTNCNNDALVINGKNNKVEGLIESNGKFEWNGENFTSGTATYGGPNNCPKKVNGPGASFGGQPQPTFDPVAHPWPAYFVPWENGFECTFNGTNIQFDQKNEVIPDGVYCAAESFEIKNEGISGKITVLAPRISVNAKNVGLLQPSTQAMNAGKPLLFFQIPNTTGGVNDPQDLDPPYCQKPQEMILNGEGAEWTGIIFNPCDRIVLNGDQNSAITALIEAHTVRLNGENFNIGNLPLAGTSVELALDE